MSPVAQPGDLVANRYRLDVCLGDSHDWATLWRGEDTMLRRPVSIRVLDAHHDRTPIVLDAARRSAAIEDGRFVRILDVADDHDGIAHVVSSWTPGRTLAEVLRDGPLEVSEAADLVADIADAIAAAGANGMAHEAVDLDNVVVTPGGEVMLLGLGVATALRSDEPDLYGDHADARALGRLLYATLTGRLPEPGADGTPPLPPRRARGGIPGPLDAICRRSLGEPTRNESELNSPRDVGAALRAWLGKSGTSASERAELRSTTGEIERVALRGEPGNRRGVWPWVIGLIVAVMLVAGAVLLIQVLDTVFSEPGGSPEPGPASTNAPQSP